MDWKEVLKRQNEKIEMWQKELENWLDERGFNYEPPEEDENGCGQKYIYFALHGEEEKMPRGTQQKSIYIQIRPERPRLFPKKKPEDEIVIECSAELCIEEKYSWGTDDKYETLEEKIYKKMGFALRFIDRHLNP
jgi:hypothetical protein